MADQIPSLGDAQRYSVNRAGSAEVIRQSIYDFNLMPAAGSTQLTFFAQPQGQGASTSPNFTGPKRLSDTNMESAGQLPAPKALLVTSIEVVFQAGSTNAAGVFSPADYSDVTAAPVLGAISDYFAALEYGFLDLFIGSKSFLAEARLSRFIPKAYTQINGAVGTAAGEFFAASAFGNGRPYYVDPPVFLVPNQNFNVTLNWPALIPMPSGFNGRIGVILDGYFYRNSQ